MRKVLVILSTLIISIGSWNYLLLQQNADQVIEHDIRNEGISVFVHFKWFIDPSIIVFDVREVSHRKSAMDVSRVLLQFAQRIKDKNYQKVILSYRGQHKFMLDGKFFKRTGLEYGHQNPIYTLRTLPQNVYNIDGSQAFPEWSGGLIGVLSKQMDDLNEFHKRWYLNNLALDN